MRLIYLIIILIVFACGVNEPSSTESEFEPEETANHMNQDTTFVQWSTEYLMGKFDPALDSNFVLIDKSYADREGLYLRKETYRAFQEMYDAALKEDVKLIIRSATRNFDYQKGIWENKWNGATPLESNIRGNTITDETQRAREILRYSSMPGSSRHHWGTDIDLNALNNRYFEQGAGKKIYDWLVLNAAKYGFCQPYSSKEHGRTGYEEEKWHWSFLPISRELTQSAQLYLHDTMIRNFAGSEQASVLGIVEHYVLGIDSSCLISYAGTNQVNN